MTLNRYLLYFSYIGTRFRGVQRQLTYDIKHNDDPSSIQGLLEYALKQLEPKNYPRLHISSRTDQGVHAFKSSAHVDLEFKYNIHPNKLVYQVNNFLIKAQVPIRLIGAQLVSNEFNARGCAKWRKYLYRLAVLKPNNEELISQRYVFPLPITEDRRCFFVYEPDFDLDLMKKVVPLFIGTKDFRTFMAKPKLFDKSNITTVRTWNSLDIVPGRSFYPTEFDNYFNYWDIYINAKSFLYKQVRRTVGVLLGVAQKKISYDDVKYMFDNPSSKSWNPKASTVPSYGLYLYDIGYDKVDLKVPEPVIELKEQNAVDSEVENCLEIKKLIVKQRIENRRVALNARISKSLEIIKRNELLRSNTKKEEGSSKR
ncbi:tRNA pseudouridine synthase-like 1 [Adelges cooleyi]|uniref:tRNA pseudouridine synthase-like 1 n=1 Tax=Adelges cooleyi TaxID=133065 RepID=UPI00217F5C59|nr:tRNA pseudouridine synthase-like 1 [Adelges cooleyi]